MLFVVGPVEEFSKLIAVPLGARRSLHFDEPGDGLVYAAASPGFASIENLGCVLAFVPAAMILRAPLSTVARAALWGIPGIRARLAGGDDARGGFRVVAGGLLAASAALGAFQHNGVRAAARRNRADVSRRMLDAVEIRLGAVSSRLSDTGATTLKSPAPTCGWRIAAISRFRRFRGARAAGRRQAAALLRTMRRPKQTGRRLLRRLRRQVRSARKASDAYVAPPPFASIRAIWYSNGRMANNSEGEHDGFHCKQRRRSDTGDGG